MKIRWPYLEPDAGGLLSIFYDSERREAASSPALLFDPSVDALGAPLSRHGINWFPDAPVQRMRRLFRDQSLNLSTMEPEASDRAIAPLASFEVARAILAEALTNAMRAIPREGRLLLALTAGKDSRTLAAALAAEGIEFETYTQTYPGIAPADVTTAQAISRYLGVRHHLVEGGVFNSGVLRAWQQHTCRAVCDADNAFFPAGQYRFAETGDVLVRGGCFEVGRRFFDGTLSDLSFDAASGMAIARRFGASPDKATALDRWLDWRRGHDGGLDLVDEFYLDQRVGGWLGAIEQGMDMLPATSLHPANSMTAFRALVTPSIKERKNGDLQVEAIRMLAPALLQWPFNPLTLRAVAGRIRRRLLSAIG